jgi:hypothetical protein
VTSWGRLSDAQADVLREHVAGRAVADLGAGTMVLAKRMIALGAARVLAIDCAFERVFGPAFEHLPISMHRGRFADCETIIREHGARVALLSWPSNYHTGVARILPLFDVVAYLGSNVDGTACGDASMWRNLRGREVLADLPDRANTLTIYGRPSADPRPSTGEEIAVLAAESGVIPRFEHVHGATRDADLLAFADVRARELGWLAA